MVKEQINQKILEFNALEMQLQEIEQQKTLIEKQIAEIRNLENSLEELKKEKKGNEMFSVIGQDIFVKSKLETTENVLVNVGSKTFVNKTIEEAKKGIELKIAKFEKLYEELIKKAEKIVEKLMKLEKEIKLSLTS